MNQQCKVCGEPAAGFHFGAFTCEGCKSFFGRSYNNLSSISECKNNSECIINKKNRTACKACRLKKCLIVGMSKNGSRYGRRSNWFKIHCLLQEQQQQREQNMQNSQPQDLMFLGMMDDYKNNRASLSSSSPSISSPDSHNSDSSVEIGDKKKINPLKVQPKMPMQGPPLTSQLASFFQLMPSPLGFPHHLVGPHNPFNKLMPPPPPLSQAAPNFLPPSLFSNPFHDYQFYAQQHQNLLQSANFPLANIPNIANMSNQNNSSISANLSPNNNNKDLMDNNLLKSKTNEFYKKYYFNKLKKFDQEDEVEDLSPANSPRSHHSHSHHSHSSKHGSPARSENTHSPIICEDNPMDLSMKTEDLINNNSK